MRSPEAVEEGLGGKRKKPLGNQLDVERLLGIGATVPAQILRQYGIRQQPVQLVDEAVYIVWPCQKPGFGLLDCLGGQVFGWDGGNHRTSHT